MAVTLTVALDDVRAIHAFDDAAASAENMTEFMDAIGSVLIAGARERIGVTNISPDGVAWPESMRVRGMSPDAGNPGLVGPRRSGGRTLHDTGALMRSITAEAGPTEVRVGSNMIYAGVHQAGATIRPVSAKALSFTLPNGARVIAGEVTIPARPYLGISDDERESITDVSFTLFNELLSGRVI